MCLRRRIRRSRWMAWLCADGIAVMPGEVAWLDMGMGLWFG